MSDFTARYNGHDSAWHERKYDGRPRDICGEYAMQPEAFKEPEVSYHDDYSHVSQTMLKCFADRRMTYYKTYVTREIPPKDATRKMDLGTAAHLALLEPHHVDEMLIEIPADMLSGVNQALSSKAAKEWVRDQQQAGKIPLKAKEMEVVRKMAASIAECELGELFKVASHRESVIKWIDDETGLPCRMKGDVIIESHEHCIGIDLKTTDDASPNAFEGVANSQKYFIQDAHYRAGIEFKFGKPCEFYFIAVETSEPFTCAVHRCEEPIEANERRRQLLRDLAACQAANHWREPWQDKINSFRIRKWA